MLICHINMRLVEGERSRENIFWKQPQIVFCTSYHKCVNLPDANILRPPLHVGSWENFWQYLWIAFLDFHRFFQHIVGEWLIGLAGKKHVMFLILSNVINSFYNVIWCWVSKVHQLWLYTLCITLSHKQFWRFVSRFGQLYILMWM